MSILDMLRASVHAHFFSHIAYGTTLRFQVTLRSFKKVLFQKRPAHVETVSSSIETN